MFLTVGILAYVYTGNTSEFAKFLLIGLASSWLGDMFLHMKQGSKVTFGIGMAFFAAAHVLYLVAYYKATKLYFPERTFIGILDIILIISTLLIFYYLFKGKGQINFLHSIMIVFAIYGLILVTMFVKAVVFGTEYIFGYTSAGDEYPCHKCFCGGRSYGGIRDSYSRTDICSVGKCADVFGKHRYTRLCGIGCHVGKRGAVEDKINASCFSRSLKGIDRFESGFSHMIGERGCVSALHTFRGKLG